MRRAAMVLSAAFSSACFERPGVERFACGPGDCTVTLTLSNDSEFDTTPSVGVRTGDTNRMEHRLQCAAEVPAGGTHVCSYEVPPKSRLRFEPGAAFNGWEGACLDAPKDGCELEVSAPLEVSARFGCVKTCTQFSCAPDGCGGLCRCDPGLECVDTVCAACTPCHRRNCGEDVCGGAWCGDCPEGEVCLDNGTCSCTPAVTCDSLECGFDSCRNPCRSTCDGYREDCVGYRCLAQGCEATTTWLRPAVLYFDARSVPGAEDNTSCDDCPPQCAAHGLTELTRFHQLLGAWLGCGADDGVLEAWRATSTVAVSVGNGDASSCFDASLARTATAIAEIRPGSGTDYRWGMLQAVEVYSALRSDLLRNDPAALVVMTRGFFYPDFPPESVRTCAGEVVVDGSQPENLSAVLFNDDMLCRVPGIQPVRVYVVGVEPSPQDGATLQRVADAGGGLYFEVSTATQARAALEAILADFTSR